MTRKHYVMIARILATIEDNATRNEVANKFANELKAENAAFKRDKFLEAVNRFDVAATNKRIKRELFA